MKSTTKIPTTAILSMDLASEKYQPMEMVQPCPVIKQFIGNGNLDNEGVRMITHIRNNIHVVTVSYSLDEVHDPEEMDATLEASTGRVTDARGVAITTHQRDMSWDCDSEAEALSLSWKLQQMPNVTVEIIEIED